MSSMQEYDVYKKEAANSSNHFKMCWPINKKPSQQKQRRFLNPEDTARLIKALEEEEREAKNPWVSYAIHLLLMTGCRLSEIRTVKWEEVDLTHKTLRLIYSKTSKKLIHLSPRALDLLKRIPKQEGNEDVIGYAKFNLINLHKFWQGICAKVGLCDVGLSHLRLLVLSFANDQGKVR